MKSHRPDLLSLGFGLLFVTVGIAATVNVLDLRLLDGDWVWATVLIGAGVAVLLTLGGRDDEPDAATEVGTGATGAADPAMAAARAEVDRADVTHDETVELGPDHADAADELGLDRSDHP